MFLEGKYTFRVVDIKVCFTWFVFFLSVPMHVCVGTSQSSCVGLCRASATWRFEMDSAASE